MVFRADLIQISSLARVFTSAALALSLAACCRGKSDGGDSSGPLSPGGGTTTGAPGTSFAGKYMSNYGPCTMQQSGSNVTGSCPGRGTTFTCAASGNTIRCSWQEGGASGKSVATKQADGKVIGTYGSGASSSNGGAWNFTPQ